MKNVFQFLIFTLTVTASWADSIVDVQGENACLDQSSPHLRSQYVSGIKRLITYCKSGDSHKATISTRYMKLERGYLSFEYAGYPEKQGVQIYLESFNGEVIPLSLSNAKESWKRHYVSLDNIKGSYRIIVKDDSSAHAAWAGLGETNIGDSKLLFSAANFVKIVAVLILLTTISAALFLFLKPNFPNTEQDAYALLIFPLLFSLVGYIGFWLFVINPLLGRSAAISFILVVLAYSTYLAKNRRDVLIETLKLILLLALPTLLYMVITFYPFIDTDWQNVAATRWRSLPIDNWLPKILASQLIDGSIKTPMVGDWLASDRPPLMTAIFLTYGSGSNSSTVYQVIATWSQCLIFLPVIYFLRRLNQHKYFVLTTSLAVATSSLLFIHSTFVWPKLLAACFVFIFFITLVDKNCKQLDWKMQSFLLGISASLAMLSHGGSFFPLIVLGIMMLIGLSNERLKILIGFTVLVVFCYLPWVLFQKYAIPPGDRLIKWHLGGQIAPVSESLFQVLVKAYSQISLDQWLSAKLINIKAITGRSLNFLNDLQSFNTKQLITNSFFYTSYAMWFLTPALLPLYMLLVRPFRSQRLLWTSLSVSLFSYLIWALLMFIKGSTIVHQGSFFPWLLVFICVCYSLYLVNKFLFMVLASANCLLGLLLYLPHKFDFGWLDNSLYIGLILALTILWLLCINTLYSQWNKANLIPYKHQVT